MNERLLKIIEYKTAGKQSDFAEFMGWSPQYLNRLIKRKSGFGIRPLIALLEKFPELNARWLLFGQGAMITSASDEVKQRLLKLLEIEKYMPVMTPEELRAVTDGQSAFDAATIERWRALLEQRNKEINDRFAAAFKKQKELSSQSTAK